MSSPAATEALAIPLNGMRGAIARAMTAGWQIPRVVHHAHANLSRLEAVRRQEAEAGRKKSITPYVLRALALTLRDHPRLNAHLVENQIRILPEINLGLAVSVTDGLMVPVIRQADALSVDELAASAAQLAQGARAGSLSAGTYQRGTFTVTNLGMTDIDAFSPILVAPQVAILGVTRVQQAVVVQEDGRLGTAPMMGLHLVFDHRAVDGHPAAVFLSDVKHRLETLDGL